MQLLETNATIAVPIEVAVCPYCGKKLAASLTEWEQSDDSVWLGIATSIDLDCEGEPDLYEGDTNAEAFDEWLAEHTYMPYVYWLPVEVRVRQWINSKYRFSIVDSSTEGLTPPF